MLVVRQTCWKWITVTPSGPALLHVIHCCGHLSLSGPLPASHGGRWLVLQSPACPDERQRCHWDYCRACVLPCRRHRAPGSLCSPPACLASEQVTDCGRRVLSLASISILKKKNGKKASDYCIFSSKPSMCKVPPSQTMHNYLCPCCVLCSSQEDQSL